MWVLEGKSDASTFLKSLTFPVEYGNFLYTFVRWIHEYMPGSMDGWMDNRQINEETEARKWK
jgi:hypothetical protein